MATTINLTRDYFAVIGLSDEEIDYNNHSAATFVSTLDRRRALLCKLKMTAAQLNSYQHKKILNFTINPALSWATTGGGTANLFYKGLNAAFAATDTRRTYTGDTSDFGLMPVAFRQGDSAARYINVTAAKDAIDTGLMLTTPSLALSAEYGEPDVGSIGTNLNAQIIFDSADAVPSPFPIVEPKEFNKADVNSFSVGWDFEPSLTEISVTNAKILLVPGGTYSGILQQDNSAWFEIPGNDQIIVGNTLRYRMSVTDSNGITTYAGPPIEIPIVHRLFTIHQPQAGSRVDRYKAQTFAYYAAAYSTDVVFKYRVSGASSWTTISTGINNNSVTISADTFSSGNYEYCWEGTDRYGVTGTSEIVPFTTVDTISTAEPTAPLGVVAGMDNGIVFRWNHIQTSGSAQTAAELQISEDGSTWEALTSVTGDAQSVTVAAGTLTSGDWYWRVRTRNLDSVWGSWSDPAVFVVVTKALTPIIAVSDSSPRPVISWQVNEQEAVEIRLDGKLYREFGTAKSWKVPDYLADGEHRVEIRALNNMGIYSEWGSADFEVANGETNAIQLTVSGGYRADLTWQGNGYDFYLVYRNGVPIGRMTVPDLTDHFSIGPTSYQVRGCYTDSANYGISTEVSVDIRPRWPVLIDVETGVKIDLDISEDQIREIEHSAGMSFASYKVAGRTFPVQVGTGFGESTTELKAAFASLEELRSFDMFLHRLVCLKTSARSVIGILETVRTVHNGFYYVVDFKISACDYPQEINIDTGVRYG